MNTTTFLVYQYCLKMWYLRSLEHAGVIQKLSILERKNGLVLSNTRVPVSGTWSILFPKKFWGGCPNIGLLWSRLPWAKTPIYRGSALKFWQHWHKSWLNHYWQHGFSIRDAITDLLTNRQFFYHLKFTSSWQPKVRIFKTPERFSSAYFGLKAMHQ